MKLIQMRAFHEVMVSGSVSEAARNMKRTQPTISSAISSLERSLGIVLFERRNNRLVPVPEAHYLHAECREVLRRIDMLRDNARRLQELQEGDLRLVSMLGPSNVFLPDLLCSFLADKRHVKCTLSSRSSPNVFQMVAAQGDDVGLADYLEGSAYDTSLVKQVVFDLHCYYAIPSTSPLVEKAILTPVDLVEQDLAGLQLNHETSRNAKASFEAAGLRYQPRFTMQHFAPLLRLVERGIACALVDPLTKAGYEMAHTSATAIVFRPFRPHVRYRVAVLTPSHRPASLLANRFVEALKRRIAELSVASTER